MGVYVFLDIDPQAISETAWAAAYDETLKLLEGWKPRLLGWRVLKYEGTQIGVYARSIRQEALDPKKTAWCVVGDSESGKTAECHFLYRDIARYLRHMDPSAKKQSADDSTGDIVVAASSPHRDSTDGPVSVFRDKTQGCPYHFAILAAAMLIEEQFPKHAMVWGDIDTAQAEMVQRMAEPILGRKLPLPVRVDAPRLMERLQGHYDHETLPVAFQRVFGGEHIDGLETMLRMFEGEAGAQAWLCELSKNKTANTVGVIQLLIAWLNSGRDIAELCRRACIAPTGPKFSPEDFVDSLALTWVSIPQSVRTALNAFQKPKGQSHTINSLFSMFLLDMNAIGRRNNVYLEPHTLESAFIEVFEEQGRVLTQRLIAASAKTEAMLQETTPNIDDFVDKAKETDSDTTETLLTIRSSEDLGKEQKNWVRLLAWHVVDNLNNLRNKPEIAPIIKDRKKIKHLIVKMLSQHGPTLTEEAWDHLIGEQNLETLEWWLSLASMGIRELHASQVRKAFFENLEIRRYAIAISRDEQELQEIEEFIKQLQTQK